MKNNNRFPGVGKSLPFILACDVSKADVHVYSVLDDRPWRGVLANSSPGLESGLRRFKEAALASKGSGPIVVALESTGVFSENLVTVARSLGLMPCWVKTEAVAKMRVVVQGDQGKTDARDPEVIHKLAANIACQEVRQAPVVYRRLREWHRVYEAAETRVVELKGMAHALVRRLFPDFDFGVDFLFGPSGQALARTYGFNPHRIVAEGRARFRNRMRRAAPRIQARSLERLLSAAALSTRHGAPDVADIEECRLQQIFEDLARQEERLGVVAAKMEALYQEARRDDPRLPEPERLVITRFQLARIVAETGPLGDFETWRALMRYAGYNLRERQSGTYRGRTRITKKGRPLLRKVLNQTALPLVRRDRLFGPYFHKKRAQGMPGTKAMTVVGRKVLKMLWGWHHSATAFNPERVFTNARSIPEAA